jgi:ketol-acid reductoisomerase
MARIDFGGVVEEVVTRDEFPLDKAREVLKDEVVAVLGYGVQGPAQSLNMRDNGINVIVGQWKGDQAAWDKAVADGWVPGETLFGLEEATDRGTIVQYLVSDAAQMLTWPRIKPQLNEGDALYFSHGFSIVYGDQTGVEPPDNVDVIMVAPKGSGTSVRANFLAGAGINSSYAVEQDYTGRAAERAIALGIAIGSGYLFPTTFEKEVHSDLTGERGVRHYGSAIQHPAGTRAQPQRGLQRDGRGADPEPDSPGGQERDGLDVRQLQHNGPARGAGLAPPLPRRRDPRLRRPL